MIIQPKGYKRQSTHSALLLSIRREIELIAARFNCSKSFVVATLLAEVLGIKEQPSYENYSGNQKRVVNARGKSKVVGIKSRKRHYYKAS
jgi:hypothetical protein